MPPRHIIRTWILAGALSATPGLLVGCGGGDPMPNVLLTSAPENPLTIDALRAGCVSGQMGPGTEITIHGRIGAPGRAIGAEAAVFTLLDLGVDFCPEGSSCCAEPDEMRARSVTVRLVDASGTPLLLDLTRVAGLRDGSEVVVRGHISSADEHAVVVDAPNLHLVRQQ